MTDSYENVYSTMVRLKVTEKEIIDNLIKPLVRNRALSSFLQDLINAYYHDPTTAEAVDTYLRNKDENVIDDLLTRVANNIKLTESMTIDETNLRVVAKRALDKTGTTADIDFQQSDQLNTDLAGYLANPASQDDLSAIREQIANLTAITVNLTQHIASNSATGNSLTVTSLPSSQTTIEPELEQDELDTTDLAYTPIAENSALTGFFSNIPTANTN